MVDITYDLNLIERQLYDKDLDEKDFLIFKDRMLDAENLSKEDLVLEALSFVSSFVSMIKSEEEIRDTLYDRYEEGYDEGFHDGKEEGWSLGYEEGCEDREEK